MKLCVFGGTGATGVNVIQVAKSNGYEVVALARRPEVLKNRFPDIQVVPGDVFKPETIKAAIIDSDAVISTLGVSGRARETTYLFGGSNQHCSGNERVWKAPINRRCLHNRNRSAP